MDIRNRKALSSFAAERLENAPQHRKIALIYASVVIGLSAVSALVSYILGLQIDQNGGLRNIGTRSILSALQTMLPLIQSIVSMCLHLGFSAAMLRIARGQYVSPQTLRLGFDRFWVLLRYSLLEAFLYVGMAFGALYLALTLFLISPWSRGLMEILLPLVENSSALDPTVAIPDAVYNQAVEAMTPALILFGILYCIVALPLTYRLRMGRYVIIDKPALGALAAMRESRKMTRHNCIALFRLDLHFWWYYAAGVLASILCYGDQLLPLIGIQLPFSPEVSFFLFYGLYWVAEYLIFYFLLCRVETSFTLAYDTLRPKEEPPKGVVLGNIFQM